MLHTLLIMLHTRPNLDKMEAFVKFVGQIFDNIDEFIAKKPEEYQEYDLERVLLSYLQMQFNTREDLKVYIENLSDEIVDKSKIKTQLTKDNIFTIKDIAKEDEQCNPKDTDKLMMVLYGENFFESTSPYNVNGSLASNATANVWKFDTDKKEGSFKAGTFMDCYEAAFLHLFNFFLYDSKTQRFDIDSFKAALEKKFKEIGWKPNTAFVNMVEFYHTKQPTKKETNRTDLDFRNAWSGKVCCNLNRKDLETENIQNGQNLQQAIYNQEKEQYDLKPEKRLKNLIYVLEKILGVKLERFGAQDQSKIEFLKEPKTDDKEKWGKWVDAKLTPLLDFLNTELSQQIKLGTVACFDHEKGKLELKVNGSNVTLVCTDGGNNPGHATVEQQTQSQQKDWKQFSPQILNLYRSEQIDECNNFLAYSHPEFKDSRSAWFKKKSQETVHEKFLNTYTKNLRNLLVYSYGYRHFGNLSMPYAINKSEENALCLYQESETIKLYAEDQKPLDWTFKQTENPEEMIDVVFYQCSWLPKGFKVDTHGSFTKDVPSLNAFYGFGAEKSKKIVRLILKIEESEFLKCFHHNGVKKFEYAFSHYFNYNKFNQRLKQWSHLKYLALWNIREILAIENPQLMKLTLNVVDNVNESFVIKNCQKLKELNIASDSQCNFDFSGCNSTSFEDITLFSGNARHSNLTIKWGGTSLKNLKKVKMSNLEAESLITDILNRSEDLVDLEIKSCKMPQNYQINNKKLEKIRISGLCLLQNLEINCPNIIEVFVGAVSSIEEFSLVNCYNLNKLRIPMLSQLESLSLKNCKNLETIDINLKNLKKIDLTGATKLLKDRDFLNELPKGVEIIGMSDILSQNELMVSNLVNEE